jgi:hypothetical protein
MPVAGRLNGRLNQMDCECGPSAGSVPGTLNANALTRVGDVARATFHLAHHELEPCDRLAGHVRSRPAAATQRV